MQYVDYVSYLHRPSQVNGAQHCFTLLIGFSDHMIIAW